MNSTEVTESDRVLESLLQERLSIQRGTIVRQLQPGKKGEETVAAPSMTSTRRALTRTFANRTGAVGSGKSLFMQRYYDALQSPVNTTDALGLYRLQLGTSKFGRCVRLALQEVCGGFRPEESRIRSCSPCRRWGVFSRNIQRRKGTYEALRKASPTEESDASKGLVGMVGRPETIGAQNRRLHNRYPPEMLVVIMDNVDRLELKDQLHAFQLTLSFMAETRSFVILQMRDKYMKG